MSQSVANTADGASMDDHHSGEPHVLPYSIYFAIYGALLVLTVVTVLVSYAGLGAWSMPVALLVAMVKASLVAGYFMHLKYDDKINSLIFVVSILFIVLFFAMTFGDLKTRGSIDPMQDNLVLFNEQAAEKAAADEAAGETHTEEAPAAH